jgi:hypothetical protein
MVRLGPAKPAGAGDRNPISGYWRRADRKAQDAVWFAEGTFMPQGGNWLLVRAAEVQGRKD